MDHYAELKNYCYEQLKCPSTEKSISKMWCIQTMEYYAVIKSGVLTQVITGTDPENIMLSGTSQTQKGKYCMLPHI